MVRQHRGGRGRANHGSPSRNTCCDALVDVIDTLASRWTSCGSSREGVGAKCVISQAALFIAGELRALSIDSGRRGERSVPSLMPCDAVHVVKTSSARSACRVVHACRLVDCRRKGKSESGLARDFDKGLMARVAYKSVHNWTAPAPLIRGFSAAQLCPYLCLRHQNHFFVSVSDFGSARA